MATGRMITNATPADKRINQLSDDTSRLAFTWLITFADREGRTYGDPGVVRSMLFPRRQDVTIERMESYIREWNALGLVVWYEADGDMWIWFPKFEKNQPGLRKEKESPSRIPPPPVETPPATPPAGGEGTPEGRTDDGQSTPEVPDKGRELKGKEGKGDAAAPDPFDLVQSWMEKATGRDPGGKAGLDTINELVKLGVLEEDIIAGVKWHIENKGPIKYYSSTLGPIKTAITKRVQNTPKPIIPPGTMITIQDSDGTLKQVVAR